MRHAEMADALCLPVGDDHLSRSAAKRLFARSAAKRTFDISFALLGMLLLAPLFLGIALCILLVEGRPVLFRHRRLGRGGVLFDCLKFRTMVVDADKLRTEWIGTHDPASAEWRATQKLKRDPRITTIGSSLRITSLDELPQLWNVLRGDMSLVGPRPIVVEEVSKYGGAMLEYLQVRPGLTGPWQISGRNNLSYETRVSIDQAYVRNWSLWTDIVIIVKTVPAVIACRGSY